MQTIQIGPGRYQMIPKKVCDECANVNLVLEERTLETEVEHGIPDGFDETKFYGEGEPEIDGDPGDLQIIYNIVKHETYERRGNDLYANMTISLPDALTGFKTEIKQLDGRKLSIKREEVTWPGMKLRIKGEGMPDYRDNTRKGNLVLTTSWKGFHCVLNQAHLNPIKIWNCVLSFFFINSHTVLKSL